MNKSNTSVQSGKGQSAKVKRGRPLKFKAFATMKVGESRIYPMAIRNSVCTAAYLYFKRHLGKIKTHKLEKSVRITRVA